MTETREVIIIGSGPAGYTAAIYTSRANLKPMLFQGPQPGGQLTITTDVENFPGYPKGVLGPDMMEDLKAQAERFGTEIKFEEVIEVDFSTRPFIVKTDFDEFKTKAVIISTGASAKLLGLDSEARLMGNGVSACATCDGAFFQDKEVMIVGAGDSALEEAQYLTRFATKVTVVHRREELRASKIMADRARENPKIAWALNRTIQEIHAGDDGKVNAVTMLNTQDQSTANVATDGVFVSIGHKPNSDLFKGQLDMNDVGYLTVTPGRTQTNIPGVFACGDVTDHIYRQAVTAAGTGCMAAIDCERWLEEQGH